MRRIKGNNHGFALVLTLVVTALMIAVAAELIHQVYVDTSLSRSFRDGQQASLLAESGVEGGIKLIDKLLKLNNPLKLEDEIGSVEISASDESGKINLKNIQVGNKDDMTLKILRQLGKRYQIPEQCWSALIDWIDSNDLPESGGAESSYYKALKVPYTARNGGLATVDELSLIKGFTPQIVARLRPIVTVYGRQGDKININTAPKEVIAALAALDSSIDDRTAERIIEERKLKPFADIGEVSARVGVSAPKLAVVVGTSGNVFRITADSKVKDTTRRVEALVRVESTAKEYLYWQEY